MATFFDTELEADLQHNAATYRATQKVYNREFNPTIKRNAGEDKLSTQALFTGRIVANFLQDMNAEIIVNFYDCHSPNHKSYIKIIEFMEYRGLLDIYKAPSNKAFCLMEIKEKAHHLIAGGLRRKSSITLTDTGKKQFSLLITEQEKTDSLFNICMRLQERINKTNKAISHPITDNQAKGLSGRFSDLLAYRKQVAEYNATYFDNGCGVRLPLVDLPHMVYSYREGHNFNRGGRISYKVNRIWHDDRASIQFKGQPTIELDFRCSLPSILLQSIGVTRDDYYSFRGFPGTYRPMFKLITVCILGAKEQKSVQRAMISKLNERWYLMEQGKEFEQFWISGQSKKEVLADIKRCCEIAIRAYMSFPALQSKLFRGKDQVSLELQYTESLIAWEIINKFVSLQKPIFCIHDSFVVLEEDMALLHDNMIEAYHNHVGVRPLPIALPISKAIR